MLVLLLLLSSLIRNKVRLHMRNDDAHKINMEHAVAQSGAGGDSAEAEDDSAWTEVQTSFF